MSQGRFILFIFAASVALESYAVESDLYKKDVPENRCESVKEYVTTLEFMKDHKEMALNEADMRVVAEKVSKGCSGAANRFARVVTLLLKAEVGSKDAVESGLEFVFKSDSNVDTFVSIFKQSFLKEGFDLTLADSMKMARNLTIEYDGDTKVAESDFAELTRFCVGTEKLDLPKPLCAQLAIRITKYGEGYKTGSAKSFIEAFEFIRSENGPALATHQALKLSEEIVAVSPQSVQNFIQGYKYGLAEKGLALDQAAAVKFAQKMSGLTRMPASEVPAKKK